MPLCTVWAEAALVKDREKQGLRNETILLHAAAADIMAGKKGKGHLNKVLKEL